MSHIAEVKTDQDRQRAFTIFQQHDSSDGLALEDWLKS